jgi:Lon protease-like protein
VDAAELVSLRAQVIDLAQQWVSRIAPDRAAAFESGRLSKVEHEVLASALSNALPFPAAEKQGLLECAGALERLRQLEALLSFQIAELGMGLTSDSQRLH